MNIIECDYEDMHMVLGKPVLLNTPGVRLANFDQGEYLPPTSPLGQYIANMNRYYESDEYLSKAREFMMMRGTNQIDVSIYLISASDMIVGALMQEYIMASPHIASMYDRGLISPMPYGRVTDPSLPYESRRRYLEAIDGVAMYDEDNEDAPTTFISSAEDDMDVLDIRQQRDIHATWDYVKGLARAGVDPLDELSFQQESAWVTGF